MSNKKYQFMIQQGNIDFGVVNTTVAVIENVAIPTQYDLVVEAMRRQAEVSAAAAFSVQESSVLGGYRALYAKLGYKPRDVVPAAEGLRRLIQKRGVMPRINPAVDLYNTVVVERMLGIGAHDLEKVEWPIVFTRAYDEEEFMPIGRHPEKVRPGDFIYRDRKKILCRLAALDCDEAKLIPESKGIVLVSEGNPATTLNFVREAVEEACRRITSICGGSYRIDHPDLVG